MIGHSRFHASFALALAGLLASCGPLKDRLNEGDPLSPNFLGADDANPWATNANGYDFGSLTNNPLDTNGLIFWNKLGSAADLAVSGIGWGLSAVGTPGFPVAVFGKGFRPNASTWLEFNATNLGSADRGTIEFWFIPDAADFGGSASFFFDTRSNGAAHNFYFAHHTPSYGLTLFGWQTAEVHTNATYKRGLAQHFAAVWDVSGIPGAGGETQQIYTNGAKAIGRSFGTRTVWSSGIVFRIGNSWDANGRYPSGIMDNLRIYNRAKTNFDDRYREAP